MKKLSSHLYQFCIRNKVNIGDNKQLHNKKKTEKVKKIAKCKQFLFADCQSIRGILVSPYPVSKTCNDFKLIV